PLTRGALVAPPGFLTVTFRPVFAARLPMSKVQLICVPVTALGGFAVTPVPVTSTVAPRMKPVPVIVIARPSVPWAPVARETFVIVGGGRGIWSAQVPVLTGSK